MTLDEVGKYIDRSKLPDGAKRYQMKYSTMAEFINKAEAKAKTGRAGFFDAVFDAVSLAYRYGMAAGYRLGRR